MLSDVIHPTGVEWESLKQKHKTQELGKTKRGKYKTMINRKTSCDQNHQTKIREKTHGKIEQDSDILRFFIETTIEAGKMLKSMVVMFWTKKNLKRNLIVLKIKFQRFGVMKKYIKKM